MSYYNPNTQEEKSYSEVCAQYHCSFPASYEVILNSWYKIHEQRMPDQEDGYRFELGGIQLIDGKYTRVWQKIPLTEEEQYSVAYSTSMDVINSSIARAYIQTTTFNSTEYSLFAKAGLFAEWAPDVQYNKGFRLVCDGIVYEVQQDVLSLENQPPFAAGMLAVYRPLSVDTETGSESDGSREQPFVFLYGMDVTKDSYYSYEGKLWLAKADMPACVWVPGTEGLWQWEEVKNEAVYTPKV